MDTLRRETLRRAALDRIDPGLRDQHPWDRALALDGDDPAHTSFALHLDRIGATPFDDVAGALLDAPTKGTPTIRRVRMGMSVREGTPASWKKLLAREGLRHVTSLDLGGAKLGPVSSLLASSPNLAQLTALGLRETGFKLDALAGSATLTNLRELDVSVNGTALDVLVKLLAASSLAHLTTLRAQALAPPAKTALASLAGALADRSFTGLALSFATSPQMVKDPVWAPLFASPALASLRALDLGVFPFSAAATKLLASPHLTRLTSLRIGLPDAALGETNLPALRSLHVALGGAKSLKALAAQPWVPSLRRLSLQFFPGQKLAGLADLYAKLRDVESLELRFAEGTHAEPELRAAWDLPQWPGLRALEIAGCPATPERLAPLLSSGALRGLETLALHGSIGPRGAELLAASSDLGALTTLHTLLGALTDAGVAALCASPHLTRLQRLGLRGTTVGKAGVDALAATDHLRDLVELAVDVSAKAALASREALAAHAKSPWLATLDAGPDGALRKVLSPRLRTDMRVEGIHADPLVEVVSAAE